MTYEPEGESSLLSRWAESFGRVVAHRAVRVGISVASVALLSGVAGYAYFSGPEDRGSETIIPIILAEEVTVKERPEDPGGYKVPHRDIAIYKTLRSADEEAMRKADALPEPFVSVGDSGDGDRELKDARAEAEARKAAAEAEDGRKEAAKPEKGTEPTEPAARDEPRSRDTASVGAPVDITRKAEPRSAETRPPSAGADGNRRYDSPPYVTPARNLATVDIMGPYRIQVGAYRSAEQAQRTWNALQARHKDVLQPLYMVIERVDLGPRGVLYRLQAGPLQTASDARTLCGVLTDRRIGCILVKG